jgi:hypothetical protein
MASPHLIAPVIAVTAIAPRQLRASHGDCSSTPRPSQTVPCPTSYSNAARLPNQSASVSALVITDEASPFALRSTRNHLRTAVRRGAARPRRSDQAAAGETLSRAGRRPHRRACMGCRAPQAPSKNTVGASQRAVLGVVAQEVRMPAAPSSPCPRPRPASGVQCPVSGASDQCPRLPVHGTRVRCGRLSVQVSAVRRPVWASGVCALPRPLCPAEVRSWSATVGRPLYGWDGRGRRGRPLRPCPARRLPESAPRARSWCRRCWASRGVGLDLAVVGGGGWAVARSTAWPTRRGRVHARIVRR